MFDIRAVEGEDRAQYIVGDLRDAAQVADACKGARGASRRSCHVCTPCCPAAPVLRHCTTLCTIQPSDFHASAGKAGVFQQP